MTPSWHHDGHPGVKTVTGQANFLSVRSPLAGSGAVSPGVLYSDNISTCENRYVRRINAPVHNGFRYKIELGAIFKKQHSHARKTWLVFSQTMSPRTLTRTCLPAAGKTAGSLRGYCTGQPNPRTLRQQPKSVRPTTGSSHSLTKETLSREQSGLNHVTV